MRMTHDQEAELALLRNSGVLQDINPCSLPTQIIRPYDKKAVSILVVSCCDGHQNADIHRHAINCCVQWKEQLGYLGEEDCYHWKTCNGGPLVLSVPEIARQYYKGEVLHLDLQLFGCYEQSRTIKGMNSVLLIGHARCGMADPHLKTISEYCERLVKAKTRFMREFDLESAQVITWLQTHRLSGERRAYHVDYKSFASAYSREPMQAVA